MELRKGKKQNSKKFAMQFLNNFFKSGSKLSCETKFLEAMCELKQKTGQLPTEILVESVSKARPLVFLKKKKIGGTNYRIPVFLYQSKSQNLGIKWLVTSCLGRKMGSSKTLLVKEFLDVRNDKGASLNKRKALNELAILNRAYIKYL